MAISGLCKSLRREEESPRLRAKTEQCWRNAAWPSQSSLCFARLSSLNADLAKEAVRDRAAAEIDQGRLDMLKTEGWRLGLLKGLLKASTGWCGWRRIPSSSASPCWPLELKAFWIDGDRLGDHSQRGVDWHRYRAEPRSTLLREG